MSYEKSDYPLGGARENTYLNGYNCARGAVPNHPLLGSHFGFSKIGASEPSLTQGLYGTQYGNKPVSGLYGSLHNNHPRTNNSRSNLSSRYSFDVGTPPGSRVYAENQLQQSGRIPRLPDIPESVGSGVLARIVASLGGR